ncbi:MAG: SDR family NAD(P)-dependent oxidoreductase, partial [Sphingobacteriales bacterium]
MEKLNGKHILVMGATGGIGTALVKLLTSSGATVYMAARNQEKL